MCCCYYFCLFWLAFLPIISITLNYIVYCQSYNSKRVYIFSVSTHFWSFFPLNRFPLLFCFYFDGTFNVAKYYCEIYKNFRHSNIDNWRMRRHKKCEEKFYFSFCNRKIATTEINFFLIISTLSRQTYSCGYDENDFPFLLIMSLFLRRSNLFKKFLVSYTQLFRASMFVTY